MTIFSGSGSIPGGSGCRTIYVYEEMRMGLYTWGHCTQT